MNTNNSDDFTDTLRDCFNVYYDHTNFALTLSSEEQGQLHNGVLLEVRSAMTHISRANCASEISMDKRIEEIKNAQGHFIRAALDGYKIAYEERMKKIENYVEMLEKYYTPIPTIFQQDRDSLERRRTYLTLEENKNPTSLKTLDDYKDLYIYASDFYEKLITQYGNKDLKRFKFKNIFMHPQWWFYTVVGAVIGTIACWFLGILF